MTPTLDVPVGDLSPDLILDLTIATRIMEAVAKDNGFRLDDLAGPRRTAGLAWARHMAMAATRRATSLSFPQIGRLYNRDHSSVVYACQRIEAHARRRPAVASVLADLVDGRSS